jgi:hypothetical protein
MTYGAFQSPTTAASRIYNQPAGNFNVAASTSPVGISSGLSSGGSINATASSRSVNPFGLGSPDFSYANPSDLKRLDISNLIYAPGVGGFITRAEADAGNFRIQGGDPNANRLASQFYSYIGGLPTQSPVTPALANLNAARGVTPTPGPSYNSVLSNFFNTASPYVQDLAKKAGFGPTFTGPKTGLTGY